MRKLTPEDLRIINIIGRKMPESKEYFWSRKLVTGKDVLTGKATQIVFGEIENGKQTVKEIKFIPKEDLSHYKEGSWYKIKTVDVRPVNQVTKLKDIVRAEGWVAGLRYISKFLTKEQIDELKLNTSQESES